MYLSIIIPVFNEAKTIKAISKRVSDLQLPGVKKEIIIINDGSSDGTDKLLTVIKKSHPKIQIITHKKNQGKGAAVITGITKARGDYIIIQDADLEYNPKDIKRIVQPILHSSANVVYGTRLKRLPNFSKDERTARFFLHYLGNKGLSLLTSLLYFHWITDMECCYKLFPKAALANTPLRARGFELEPEITAKLLKNGYKIVEVPISTNPRGYDEGKKLDTVRDGIKAVKALLKYRFMN